jgi:hypothetical protein
MPNSRACGLRASLDPRQPSLSHGVRLVPAAQSQAGRQRAHHHKDWRCRLGEPTLECELALTLGMKASRVRLWIEVLALVSAVACALALLLVTVGAAAGSGGAEPESGRAPQSSDVHSETYEGMITDARCGAKHSAAVGKSASDCTRLCVHSGEQFALVDGEKMFVLQGQPEALKRAAGERVKIVGTLNGNIISVASVATTAAP